MSDITSLLPATATPSSTSSIKPQNDAMLGDFNSFVKLLTVQLENQDPMNPTDSTDFTNQLVSFSIANQSLQTNDYLNQLVKLQAETKDSIDTMTSPSSKLSSLMHFIGKDVSADGSTSKLLNDNSSFFFSIDDDLSSAQLDVLNQNNMIVHSESIGPLEKGLQSFNWNGLNKDGNPLPEDVYKLQISPSADSDVSFKLSGPVQSVTLVNGNPMFIVNGVIVDPSQLTTLNS